MQDKISGKLAVHITFHFNSDRFKYLFKVISNVNTYVFDNLKIFVHTNSDDSAETIYAEFPDVECIVHDSLSHPFDLTWVHRKYMQRQLNDFDFFMYLEDDILVPSDAIKKWKSDTELLSRHGFARGFIRVETSPEGRLVVTDFMKRIKIKKVLIDNLLFFSPTSPYHAFWIYNKEQMNNFVSTPSWKDEGNCSWEIRERAAAGMLFEKIPKGCFSRALVPLSKEGQLDKDTFVYHLPNNYAYSNYKKKTGHGTISPDDLIYKTFFERFTDYLKNIF